MRLNYSWFETTNASRWWSFCVTRKVWSNFERKLMEISCKIQAFDSKLNFSSVCNLRFVAGGTEALAESLNLPPSLVQFTTFLDNSHVFWAQNGKEKFQSIIRSFSSDVGNNSRKITYQTVQQIVFPLLSCSCFHLFISIFHFSFFYYRQWIKTEKKGKIY